MERYDYVIVGAGSAGCTLAARLTEADDVRVLLLEAGGWDRDPWIHIPLGWGRILQHRKHDWMYFAEPEESVGNRRVECARGKVVGGSSSTNAMAHVRGNRADYDRWAAQGLPEWSYDQVLPLFRRQERWEGGADPFRGADGPLAVQRCRYQDPLVEAFAAAGRSAGFGWTEDYNGAVQDGFARLQMTIRNGRRCSAAVAYLRPALRRGRITLRTRALATGVVTERGRATGVRYAVGTTVRVARAAREVILCGGAINSPQLLLLSGIGPADAVKRHGITPLVDLPGVGANLQDHVSAVLVYARSEPGPFQAALRFDRIAPSVVQAYLFGTGFAADVPGGVTAFLRSREATTVPDIQILFTAAPFGVGPWLRKPFQDGFATRVVMLHPESRGAVTLATADPARAPVISQNFLSAAADWRVLRAGLRMAREVAAQPVMLPFIGRELAPGAARQDDAALDAHIRGTAITVHHPAGTCRMGAANDRLAVVDSALCVRGVEGLRVVDASVMPDLVSGNINAAVVMIAERAAELIAGRATAPSPVAAQAA